MIRPTNAITIGYHGCSKSVFDSVIYEGEKLKPSQNDYDWLGNGIYFWENDISRAEAWANQVHRKAPAVIGAVIDLSSCLDLTTKTDLDSLREAYQVANAHTNLRAISNSAPNKAGDILLRPRDCFVIEFYHNTLRQAMNPKRATRGVFFEGTRLFRGSAFKSLSHIQIAVRDHSAILGYFIPAH